jgi:hypothetical protein
MMAALLPLSATGSITNPTRPTDACRRRGPGTDRCPVWCVCNWISDVCGLDSAGVGGGELQTTE